jgi:hypothetical protein
MRTNNGVVIINSISTIFFYEINDQLVEATKNFIDSRPDKFNYKFINLVGINNIKSSMNITNFINLFETAYIQNCMVHSSFLREKTCKVEFI